MPVTCIKVMRAMYPLFLKQGAFYYFVQKDGSLAKINQIQEGKEYADVTVLKRPYKDIIGVKNAEANKRSDMQRYDDYYGKLLSCFEKDKSF